MEFAFVLVVVLCGIVYLFYIIHPQLSDEAAEELTRGYVEIRKRGNFPGSSKKVISFTSK